MKYKSKKLTIIGVPSNDFGGQSPESNEEFKKFCELNYGVKFPILRKSNIKGSNKTPLYQHLTSKSPTKGEVRWNFEKFLIDKDGNISNRFKSSVTPNSQILIKSIEKLFRVNVIKVNIINQKTKLKVKQGRDSYKSGYKKAIITLKKGQSIDLTTGI